MMIIMTFIIKNIHKETQESMISCYYLKLKLRMIEKKSTNKPRNSKSDRRTRRKKRRNREIIIE